MFYIIDKDGTFYRTHPRWNSPDPLYMDNAMDYAIRFPTRNEADKMLNYWKLNNDFQEGTVVSSEEALNFAG